MVKKLICFAVLFAAAQTPAHAGMGSRICTAVGQCVQGIQGFLAAPALGRAVANLSIEAKQAMQEGVIFDSTGARVLPDQVVVCSAKTSIMFAAVRGEWWIVHSLGLKRLDGVRIGSRGAEFSWGGLFGPKSRIQILAEPKKSRSGHKYFEARVESQENFESICVLSSKVGDGLMSFD